MNHDNRKSSPSGFTLIYCLIAVTALTAMVSLAVDLGRVQVTKTQLQATAAAAARAGATALVVGDNQVRVNAITVGSDNQADGTPVALASADIEIGNWDDTMSAPFSTSRLPVNAVRVKAERTAARGNAVPLMFAFLIGFHSCDIRASAVATSEPLSNGFIGLDGIDVKNNLVSASYNSSVYQDPTVAKHYAHGMLGSNGAISAKNNEVVGQVVLGPGGTSNLNVRSGPLVLPNPIPTPVVDFSGAPASNPNGTPQNLNVNGNVTLGAGTYYFTSISIANNGKLSFLGPATVYVDGNVAFAQNGEIEASAGIPANLKILQRGVGSEFGTSTANSISITAVITAPQSKLSSKNSMQMEGGAVFKTIEAKNNADFYYDQSLKSTLPGVPQRWPIVSVQ